jgi:hypothetical protein
LRLIEFAALNATVGEASPAGWQLCALVAIAAIAMGTQNIGRHLSLYRDREPSEQPAERRLSDLTDEELIQRILCLKGMRAVKLNRDADGQTIDLETQALDHPAASGRAGDS